MHSAHCCNQAMQQVKAGLKAVYLSAGKLQV